VKDAKWHTCLCPKHLGMHRIREQYSKLSAQLHKDCTCDCSGCSGGGCSDHTRGSTNDILEGIVPCERSDDHYMESPCVRHTHTGEDGCSTVGGFSNWTDCPLENSTTKTVDWIDYVPTKTPESTVGDDGEIQKIDKITFVKTLKTTTWADFTARVQLEIIGFLEHRQCATVAANSFDDEIDNLEEGRLVILADFGMNHSCVHGQECQSEFFQHRQVTVLPVICYRKGADGLVWAHSYAFLSDDLDHDDYFFRHCLKEVLARVRADTGDDKSIARVSVWSDGCKQQFKSKRQIYSVSQPHIDIPNYTCADGVYTRAGGTSSSVRVSIRMSHCYFASCHGKGPSDAETSRIKTKARRLERSLLKYMTNAQELHDGLAKYLEKIVPSPVSAKRRHSLWQRQLIVVPKGACPRPRNAKVVTGLESQVMCNHGFYGTGTVGVVLRRWMPCSCERCRSSDYGCSTRACLGTGHNETPVRAELNINSIDTATSDAARLKAERATQKVIEQATSLLVCAFYRGADSDGGDGDAGTLASGDGDAGAKPYWLGAVTSKPIKHRSVWHVLAYLYDETVVTDERGSLRIAYDEPASGQKCPCAFGKCKGRASCVCKLWHETLLPIGSIVPKLLVGRNLAKYFKRTAADAPYMLSEGWGQKIDDELQAADDLVDGTMELL